MHKPFDLDAAKAGEPVEYLTEHSGWVKVHFVGATECGDPVIQRNDCRGSIHPAELENLRMAAKKVTVRYRVGIVRRESGDLELSLACNEWTEGITRNHPGFIDWLTEWQEVEIPQ